MGLRWNGGYKWDYCGMGLEMELKWNGAINRITVEWGLYMGLMWNGGYKWDYCGMGLEMGVL